MPCVGYGAVCAVAEGDEALNVMGKDWYEGCCPALLANDTFAATPRLLPSETTGSRVLSV